MLDASSVALKRPPVLFRNEFVFGSGPRFAQTYAFRVDKGFQGKPAFLASILTLPAAGRFRRRARRAHGEGFVPGGPPGRVAGRAIVREGAGDRR